MHLRLHLLAALLIGPALVATLPGAAPAVRPPLVPSFHSVAEALDQPQSRFFGVERRAGSYRLSDPQSHFNASDDLDLASFDVSNNEVLANVSVSGTVESMSVYRDSYRVNCGTSGKSGTSGVWVAKDNSTYGPYSYQVVLDGETHDLGTAKWDFHSGLLDDLFPVTEHTDAQHRLRLRTIVYAPTSADGTTRIRGLVYNLHVTNVSHIVVRGEIRRPALSYPGRSKATTRDLYDPFDFDLATGTAGAFSPDVPFTLAPGASLWVPTFIYAPGPSITAEVLRTAATPEWFASTWTYYRRLLGRLTVARQPFLADFYEREALQALQSMGLSESGRFVGSNWGSSPTTRQIWMKDCYYSALPFMTLDPELAKKIIPWFDEFGIRQDGTELEGGISHALGLTVASPLLAGLYYDATGDKTYFVQHPELRASWDRVLTAVVASRVDPDVWLFPTRWVSDGAVEGDYHTGSNVTAWRALAGYARLLDEVYGDPARAADYRRLADNVRQSLLARTVVSTARGPQFVDEAYRDGRAPKALSNGEESDVTLMPFYGLGRYDEPAYLNFMRFSVSSENLSYNARLRSLTWREKIPSTSPGYNKGLCAGLDEESEFGEHGYYTELRHLADLDGSVWWWSYGKDRHPVYGRLTRAYGGNGKAGWTAGVHTVLFPSRFLGMAYDAPKREFSFAPLRFLGDFEWRDFPAGRDRFSVGIHYDNGAVRAEFENPNAEAIQLIARLPCPASQVEVSVDGSPRDDGEIGSYLGQPVVRLNVRVGPAGHVNIVISPHSGAGSR